jgi:hypothetical protein
VYQAYRPSIAQYAVQHGQLGGPEFRAGRMSWIKPSFLWMMYRSAWATKPDQQAVLALRMKREGFGEILAQTVPSTFATPLYGSHEEWRRALDGSDVRLQWDPDHDPAGAPCDRRAIQLGLRGRALERFVAEWVVEIEDITPLVIAQRSAAADELVIPKHDVCPVDDHTAARLGLSH